MAQHDWNKQKTRNHSLVTWPEPSQLVATLGKWLKAFEQLMWIRLKFLRSNYIDYPNETQLVFTSTTRLENSSDWKRFFQLQVWVTAPNWRWPTARWGPGAFEEQMVSEWDSVSFRERTMRVGRRLFNEISQPDIFTQRKLIESKTDDLFSITPNYVKLIKICFLCVKKALNLTFSTRWFKFLFQFLSTCLLVFFEKERWERLVPDWHFCSVLQNSNRNISLHRWNPRWSCSTILCCHSWSASVFRNSIRNFDNTVALRASITGQIELTRCVNGGHR